MVHVTFLDSEYMPHVSLEMHRAMNPRKPTHTALSSLGRPVPHVLVVLAPRADLPVLDLFTSVPKTEVSDSSPHFGRNLSALQIFCYFSCPASQAFVRASAAPNVWVPRVQRVRLFAF